MKLLLDELANVRLRHLFPDHDARTVDYMRWKGTDNGELLAPARQEFDVFVTRDREMPDQWNITSQQAEEKGGSECPNSPSPWYCTGLHATRPRSSVNSGISKSNAIRHPECGEKAALNAAHSSDAMIWRVVSIRFNTISALT